VVAGFVVPGAAVVTVVLAVVGLDLDVVVVVVVVVVEIEVEVEVEVEVVVVLLHPPTIEGTALGPEPISTRLLVPHSIAGAMWRFRLS
jgi:hypothetical protein